VLNGVSRARRLAGKSRVAFQARRAELTVRLGGSLGQAGRLVVLQAYRGEEVALPAQLVIGDTKFDILDDLTTYSGLPRATVDSLVRRELDSFRAEWYLTPDALRFDDWFYRATNAYLFGNSVHLYENPELLAVIVRSCGENGRALEFGGGTGNLALALAAVGWSVDYLERSALQKDFVAFRVDKYGLGDRVRILDDWRPLDREAYDLVCAIDVLEHVDDLRSLLVERLIPSIRGSGFLAESSPFVRNVSNPMHHEHDGLEGLLTDGGFRVQVDTPECRVWHRSEASVLS
jgi:hypothetical protein